jgi:hypothetical protein
VDHRQAIRLVRTLADGEEALRAELASLAAPDLERWQAFLTQHRLLDWVAPALCGEPARAVVPDGFREALLAQRAARLARNAVLLRESVELRDALAAACGGGLFLKGLYFDQRFYPDTGRRHQADVDVLVRADALESALGAAEKLGYDLSKDVDTGQPLARALREIRGANPQKAPHGVALARGRSKLDVHWCLASRSLDRIDEEPLWRERRGFALEAHAFETLGDEHTLEFLLLSLCSDLRRGACREKHFLDLYLMLRAFGRDLDWEGFLARRRRERVERPCVNVLAVFLELWDCAGELPELAAALRARRRLIELDGPGEAVALIERPRGNRENRTWYRRVYPRSLPRFWAWRLTRDLRHTLTRAGGQRP